MTQETRKSETEKKKKKKTTPFLTVRWKFAVGLRAAAHVQTSSNSFHFNVVFSVFLCDRYRVHRLDLRGPSTLLDLM